ncbi:MAG: DUF1194 domain-containing protein, partial [Pseudomonadota bacterium]|nr:DUF1194 domain-containing protein [Pseudomonadota bacterium]
ALAILQDGLLGPRGKPWLVEAYEAEVIGGPGAFTVTVTSRKEFSTAIRRKLLLEIVDAGGGVTQADYSEGVLHSDCLVGERTLEEWLEGGRDE